MSASTDSADESKDGARIDMTRAAMEQALEAIEDSGCKADLMAAADALRAALAEQPPATADVSLGAAIEAIDAALAEQAQPVLPAGWDIERDSNRKWVTVRNLASQLGQDFYPDRDPLIFAFLAALNSTPPAPQPLTERELELLDGMIEVQLHHAAQCDLMLTRAGGNHIMAERQKGWDMERVELLRKIRRMGVQR